MTGGGAGGGVGGRIGILAILVAYWCESRSVSEVFWSCAYSCQTVNRLCMSKGNHTHRDPVLEPPLDLKAAVMGFHRIRAQLRNPHLLTILQVRRRETILQLSPLHRLNRLRFH